jgi:hypothetical protein
MITSKSPYFFGQPLSNPVEAYALRNKFDSQAPWYDQALQVMSNPLGPMFGGLAADRAFAAMDQNERVLAELKAAGVPITTDRYGNYIPAGGSSGLLASFGRSMGMGGTGGTGGGGLLGLFGGGSAPAPQHYGGYVIDASNNPIRSGDGFVTYGSGPQSVGNEAFAGEVGYDQ